MIAVFIYNSNNNGCSINECDISSDNGHHNNINSDGNDNEIVY